MDLHGIQRKVTTHTQREMQRLEIDLRVLYASNVTVARVILLVASAYE